MPEVASLTQAEAAERAALLDVRALRHRGRHARACSTGDAWSRPPRSPSAAASPARRRSSTASPRSASATLNGVDARPRDRRRRPDPAARPGRRQRAGGLRRPVRHGRAPPASCAPSTRPTSWSTSGPPSSPTRRAGCGPASTSPTSRRRTGSRCCAPDGVDGHQQHARPTSVDGPRRRRPAVDLPGHPAAVDVRRRRQRRAVPRDPRAARRPQPRALLPAVAASSYLERDAAELFELTAQGLAFFGEQFGQPFPQERYDQVFVPNMGGAMENWGCVTWTDSVPDRSRRRPTASARSSPTCCSTRWRTCGSATW